VTLIATSPAGTHTCTHREKRERERERERKREKEGETEIERDKAGGYQTDTPSHIYTSTYICTSML
jgi:hypothetical protein